MRNENGGQHSSEERKRWERFAQSGAVMDYLAYCGWKEREPDPKRRVEQISGKKHFYC